MASPISYLIILTDATQYATLSAQYPNGIQIPPQQAATLYGIPIEPPVAAYPGVSVPLALATDPGARAPYGNALVPFLNTQTFTVSALQSWGGGDFFWVGYFRMVVFVPPPAVVAKLGQRRWIDGFEIPQTGEGGSNFNNNLSRVASRTVDGLGFAYRPVTGQNPRIHSIAAALQAPTSWERLYIRPRVLPVGGSDSFWEMQGSVIGGLAVVLAITTGGNLVGYSKGNTAYPGNLLFTSTPLTVGTWYRLDLRIHFRAQNVASEHGSLSLYINGTLAGTASAPDGDTGLGTIQTHIASQLGYESTQPAAFGSEIDFDDWISANEIDIPAGPYPKSGTSGFDLTVGSHIVLVRPTGFGPNQDASYTGPWQAALVNPPLNIDSSVQINSATASAELQVTTDYATKNPTVAIATSAIGASGSTDTAVTMSAIGAGVVVNLTATSQPSMLYSAPDDTRVDSAVLTIPSLTLQAIKANNTNPLHAAGFLAAAEQYGNFGPDDAGAVAPAAVGESAVGIHNAPYPKSSAQVSVTAPAGQVQVHAFTYTGTGAGLQILLDLAPHWWFVRRTDTQNSGVWWWSSMETAHGWLAKDTIPNLLAQVGLNGLGQAAAQIVGTTVAANSATGTYQVVAVSDPAMRYLMNGGFAHPSTLGSAVNTLVDAAFTPEAAFFFIESILVSGITGSYVKGIGHTAASASPMDGVVNNSVATLGAGSITSQAAIHTLAPATAFSAWRRDDGSGNTGWFDLVTYVGNGAGGTRVIACALGGKSPLFAIVTPHNGTSYLRDPSNTTTHSQTFASVDSTTGIVGGDLNAISVGTALNANGVVYDVFVIASNVASAGNWGTNPASPFNPVPTIIRPTAGPYAAAPAPVPAPDGGCISLGTAITEVAYRLGDASATHWTSAELTRYLLEALRVWNALTLTARDRGSFVLTAATPFYDLPTKLPTLLPHTLKDTDLVTDLEYLLQEPPTPTAWTGTAMFTLAQLTAALNRRRDLFLYTTGAVVTRETALVTPDGNGRVALPVDVIELRRAAWQAGVLVSPLVRDSEWAMNAYGGSWPTPVVASAARPKAYSVGVTPPLTVQLAPPPTAQGTLDTVSVTLGATLNPATGVLLGIPDDFAWVVKWGALRDLLAVPGPANDPARAAIADQLWSLGLAASKVATTVLDARINGTPVRITGVADADRFSRSWQATQGVPKQVLTAGQNLIAVSPVPDAVTPYTLLLDVVRNQPVPVVATDCYFEGGVAMTAAMLDYATFCARFKEGPAQADEASALLESFLKATGVAVAIDRARLLATRAPLLEESRRSETITPREIT